MVGSFGHGRHFLVLGTDAVVLILAIVDLFDFFFGGFNNDFSNDTQVIGRGMFVFVALLLYSILRISQSKRKGNFALYIVCLTYVIFHAIYPDSTGMSLKQLNLTIIIFSWTGFRASLQLFMCFIFMTVSLVVSNNRFIAIEIGVVFLLYFGFGILSWQLQLYLAEEFCWCRKDISLALRNLPYQFFASDERVALSVLAPIMARKELTFLEAEAIFTRTVQIPHFRDSVLAYINDDAVMDAGTTSAAEHPLRPLLGRTMVGPETLKKRPTLFLEPQPSSSAVRRLRPDEMIWNGRRLNSVEPRLLLKRRNDLHKLWPHSIDSLGNRLNNAPAKGADGKMLRKQKTTVGPPRHSVTININRGRRRSATAQAIARVKINPNSPVSSGQNLNSGDDGWCTPKTCVTRLNSSVQSSDEFCNFTSNLDHKSKHDAYEGPDALQPVRSAEHRPSRKLRFSLSAHPPSTSPSDGHTPAQSVVETTRSTRRSVTTRGTMGPSYSTTSPVRRMSEVFIKLDAETDAWRRPSLLACVRRSDSIHKYMLSTKSQLSYPRPGAADKVYLSPYRGILKTQAKFDKPKKKRTQKRRKQNYEYKRRSRRRKRKTTTITRFQDSPRSDDVSPCRIHSSWRDVALSGEDLNKGDGIGIRPSSVTASTAQSSQDKFLPKPNQKSGEDCNFNTARTDRRSLRSTRSRRRRSQRRPSTARPFTARSRAPSSRRPPSRSASSTDNEGFGAGRSEYFSSASPSSSPESHDSSSSSTSFESCDANRVPHKRRRPQRAADAKYLHKPTMSGGDRSLLSWFGRGFCLLRMRIAVLETVIQEGGSDVRAQLPTGNVFGTFSDRKIERWYLAWSSVVRARIFCSMWSSILIIGLMTPLTLTIVHIVSYLRIQNPQLSVAKFAIYVSFRCVIHCALMFAVTFPQRRSRFRGSLNAHHFIIRGIVAALLLNIFSPSDYIVAIACGDSQFNSVKYIYLPLAAIPLISLASPSTYSLLYWSIALAACIAFIFFTNDVALSFLSNIIQFYVLHYFFITRPYSEVLRRMFSRFVLPYILLIDCLLPLKSDKLMGSYYSSTFDDEDSFSDSSAHTGTSYSISLSSR